MRPVSVGGGPEVVEALLPGVEDSGGSAVGNRPAAVRGAPFFQRFLDTLAAIFAEAAVDQAAGVCVFHESGVDRFADSVKHFFRLDVFAVFVAMSVGPVVANLDV